MISLLVTLLARAKHRRALRSSVRKLRINLQGHARNKKKECIVAAQELLRSIVSEKRTVEVLGKKIRAIRKYWVRPLFQDHETKGAWFTLIPKMKAEEPDKFYNFFRMSTNSFDELLALVGPHIRKKTTWLRKPISPGERLAIALRFFATGDSYVSLSYLFLVSDQIISQIVLQVSVAIWCVLEPIVFEPLTEDMWLRVAAEFEVMWHFQHCCGAIDGKHVHMHAPPLSGSRFRNYKQRFSMILMAVASAKRKFIVVDVGSSGQRGDGNVYHSCAFGKMLEQQLVNFPPPCAIEGIEGDIPFALLGDGAFERSQNLLNSFKRKKGSQVLNAPERVFNVRFSGARHVIEDAFGLLYKRYGMFHRSIEGSRTLVKYATLACCALHNFNLNDEKSVPPTWRRERPDLYRHTTDEDGNVWPGRYKYEDPQAEREALQRLRRNVEEAKRSGVNVHDTLVGEDIREILLDHFIKHPVPWQWKKACVGRRFATEPEVKKHIDNHMNPHANKGRRPNNNADII